MRIFIRGRIIPLKFILNLKLSDIPFTPYFKFCCMLLFWSVLSLNVFLMDYFKKVLKQEDFSLLFFCFCNHTCETYVCVLYKLCFYYPTSISLSVQVKFKNLSLSLLSLDLIWYGWGFWFTQCAGSEEL